jgi:hypothetical protein
LWVTSGEIHGVQSGIGADFSLSSLVFTVLVIIPPSLLTHLSQLHEACSSPESAAHYHTLGLKLGFSSQIHHLAGLGFKYFYVTAHSGNPLRYNNPFWHFFFFFW